MEEGKSKGNYIFPNFLAQGMSKVSQRTQFESELMSLVMILLGIIATAVYILFYTNMSLFLKIMTGFNALAAFILLTSRMITSYQQYRNFMEISGLIKEVKHDNNIW